MALTRPVSSPVLGGRGHRTPSLAAQVRPGPAPSDERQGGRSLRPSRLVGAAPHLRRSRHVTASRVCAPDSASRCPLSRGCGDAVPPLGPNSNASASSGPGSEEAESGLQPYGFFFGGGGGWGGSQFNSSHSTKKITHCAQNPKLATLTVPCVRITPWSSPPTHTCTHRPHREPASRAALGAAPQGGHGVSFSDPSTSPLTTARSELALLSVLALDSIRPPYANSVVVCRGHRTGHCLWEMSFQLLFEPWGRFHGFSPAPSSAPGTWATRF